MATLERTKASVFTLDDAFTLGELESMSESERLSALIPIERVFEKYERIELAEFFERLARCGCEIYLHKIGKSLPLGGVVALYGKSGFFALGEVREFEGGLAIKPIKQFDT